MTTPFNLASFADKVSSTGTANPSAISDIANTSTGALGFPVGTTAQRNGTPVNGMTRINSTTNVLEVYYNGSWVTISTFTPPAPPAPTVIGQAYAGGYYAGKISTTANGVATHYLVVAPKATGEIYGKVWGPATTTTATSDIDGPNNTNILAALGSGYEAATWCKSLTIGGYTDWYLPAVSELEVLYYFLKPTVDSNFTSIQDKQANPYAVSPEPLNTVYSAGSPAQTTSIIFRDSGAEAFIASSYQSSTENSSTTFWRNAFSIGFYYPVDKTSNGYYARAIRRVPV